MTTNLRLAAALSLLATSLIAGVSTFDWCRVETPDSLQPGDQFTVQITPTSTVPGGKQISCHLHWSKPGGGGFLQWAPAKPCTQGKPVTFAYRPKLKPGTTAIHPIVFLSDSGDFNKADKVARPKPIPLATQSAPAPISTPAAQRQGSHGWCTLTAPSETSCGKRFTVTVATDSAAPKGKLACHLHWGKRGGGGFLQWAPPKEFTPGQTVEFTYSPKLKTDIETIIPVVFISENGDFNKAFKTARGQPIRVTIDAETLAREKRQARPATATLKKSWLRIIPPKQPVRSGEAFDIRVDYSLDPSDNWAEGTSIELMPLGPWIDNPDGIVNKSRHHVDTPGLGYQCKAIKPGRGTLLFRQRIRRTHRYNSLLWMARFKGGDGKAWPWSVRAGGPSVKADCDRFSIRPSSYGGVFTYGSAPELVIEWPEGSEGREQTISCSISTCEGTLVKRLEVRATPPEPFHFRIEDLPNPQGLFLVEAELRDKASSGDKEPIRRACTFALIPDVPALLGADAVTPFGVTDVRTPENSALARRIGASWCRHFTGWGALEPKEGFFCWDDVDEMVAANCSAGLRPWLMLIGPPCWAVAETNLYGAGFMPYPFRPEALERSVKAIAQRYRNRICGMEWQNEIVPGSLCQDPVKTYLDFCRTATRALKSVAPEMEAQLAGGLWPRNYRTDLIAAGIGETIDVLPIHYGDGDGVRQARQDSLAADPSGRIRVIDNETACGYSVWGMPMRQAVTNSIRQCAHILRRWPGELVAGAERIVYFGGSPDPAGNWSMLLDSRTPRPVLATYAVLASKLGNARPVGETVIGGARLCLFEAKGKGIAVLGSISENESAPIQLTTGSDRLLATDYQGRNQTLQEVGTFHLTAKPLPVFLEGFRFEELAILCSLEAERIFHHTPGTEGHLRAWIQNPYANRPFKPTATFTLDGAELSRQTFELPPGAGRWVQAPIPQQTKPEMRGTITLAETSAHNRAERTFTLLTVDPARLGNQLQNSSLEATTGAKPNAWSTSGKIHTFTENKPGLHGRALRFENTKSWSYAAQSIPVDPAVDTYLYTAWLWNKDMEAGSNLGLTTPSGKTTTATMPFVFTAPRQGTGFWRLMTHKRKTAGLKSICFTPVVNGKGFALFDNIRAVPYEGSDFVAEAKHTAKPIAVDGDPSDWNLDDEPIPLLCDNQLTASADYNWTPQNLSGIARIAWDEQGLLLCAWVRDDRHHPSPIQDNTTTGDALFIALHPANCQPGTEALASQWILSSASPGGGSGGQTLYRPVGRSGGKPAGQLAKDSSVYEMKVGRKEDCTTYEIRIPWSEVGIAKPAPGLKLGLSLRLLDSDGGSAQGAMSWGAGISPRWAPSAFGRLILKP